jgi:hypothetical protein
MSRSKESTVSGSGPWAAGLRRGIKSAAIRGTQAIKST